jgi:cell division protein FtsI (penicillin-binding protein 3)
MNPREDRFKSFPKTHRVRLVLLILSSVCAFTAIMGRLFWLQIHDYEAWRNRADYQQHKKELLSPRRGSILDRNDTLLAGSHFAKTIVLNTRHQPGEPGDLPEEALVQDLAETLGKQADLVRKWFAEPGYYTVARKAPDEVIQQIASIASHYDLPDEMIRLTDTGKRNYPNGNLAAHVIGFTQIDDHGSDNIGLDGLELQYNDWLTGEYREVRLQVGADVNRRGLHGMNEESIEATFGHDLVLTIDQRIQMLAERALSQAVGLHQAVGGVAIVMDVPTGEILALVNCPDFDPNTFREQKVDPEQLRNRALNIPIEIGSVMKIVSTAILLDNNLLSVEETIDGRGGSIQLGTRRIRDSHPMGLMNFRTAFAESSNVVMATLVDSRLDANIYYDGLRRFGLGDVTGIDLPGERRGVLRTPSHWTALSKASLSIGYETELTPPQVVTALGAIGNNGWRMRPHLVREIRNAKGETIQRTRPEPLGRAVSPETCRTMLELMEAVVVSGTGRKEGQVAGYRAGGKTGTTRKFEADDEGNPRFIASFAGLVPIDRPKLAIYVYVDEPKGAKFYGGDVAAPVFREIAEQALPLLGIPPSDPQAYEEALIASRPAADSVAGATGATEAVESAVRTARSMSAGPILPDEAGDVGPKMPDCRGLTMLQTWEKLGRAGIEARLLGSGLATGQEPRAGERLVAGRVAKVIFTFPPARTGPRGAAEGETKSTVKPH